MQKTDIENDLGYSVEQVNGGIPLLKDFPINKHYEELVKEFFPYILDFIRVFEPYVKAYAD